MMYLLSKYEPMGWAEGPMPGSVFVLIDWNQLVYMKYIRTWNTENTENPFKA